VSSHVAIAELLRFETILRGTLPNLPDPPGVYCYSKAFRDEHEKFCLNRRNIHMGLLVPIANGIGNGFIELFDCMNPREGPLEQNGRKRPRDPFGSDDNLDAGTGGSVEVCDTADDVGRGRGEVRSNKHLKQSAELLREIKSGVQSSLGVLRQSNEQQQYPRKQGDSTTDADRVAVAVAVAVDNEGGAGGVAFRQAAHPVGSTDSTDMSYFGLNILANVANVANVRESLPTSMEYYNKILSLGTPQVRPKESYRTSLDKGESDKEVEVVSFETDIAAPEKVFLVKFKNPARAYRQIPKAPQRLAGDLSGFGESYQAYILPRMDSADGQLAFRAPPPEDVQFVTIKKINKEALREYLGSGGQEDPYKEIALRKQMGDDIHVLKLIEALEDERYVYIVADYHIDDSLFDNVPVGLGCSDSTARTWFAKILEILSYLEKHNIYHSALTPDNFVFVKDKLVLVRLGLAIRIPPPTQDKVPFQIPVGPIGSLPFQAPEVHSKGMILNGASANLWSASVTLYYILTGRTPYGIPHPADPGFRVLLSRGSLQTMTKFLKAEAADHVVSEEGCTSSVSPEAMDLLSNLLKVVPTERWSCAQALASRWVQGNYLVDDADETGPPAVGMTDSVDGDASLNEDGREGYGETVVTPGPHDVLLGRGNDTNNHSGNRAFRALVSDHKMRYAACGKNEKPKVAREVVDIWKNLHPPGRFLARKDDDSDQLVWVEVPAKKAREKASQCLRERSPEVAVSLRLQHGQSEYAILQQRHRGAAGFYTPFGQPQGQNLMISPSAQVQMVHHQMFLRQQFQQRHQLKMRLEAEAKEKFLAGLAAGTRSGKKGPDRSILDALPRNGAAGNPTENPAALFYQAARMEPNQVTRDPVARKDADQVTRDPTARKDQSNRHNMPVLYGHYIHNSKKYGKRELEVWRGDVTNPVEAVDILVFSCCDGDYNIPCPGSVLEAIETRYKIEIAAEFAQREFDYLQQIDVWVSKPLREGVPFRHLLCVVIKEGDPLAEVHDKIFQGVALLNIETKPDHLTSLAIPMVGEAFYGGVAIADNLLRASRRAMEDVPTCGKIHLYGYDDNQTSVLLKAAERTFQTTEMGHTGLMATAWKAQSQSKHPRMDAQIPAISAPVHAPTPPSTSPRQGPIPAMDGQQGQDTNVPPKADHSQSSTAASSVGGPQVPAAPPILENSNPANMIPVGSRYINRSTGPLVIHKPRDMDGRLHTNDESRPFVPSLTISSSSIRQRWVVQQPPRQQALQ
jgi:serine/threonine protein kinase